MNLFRYAKTILLGEKLSYYTDRYLYTAFICSHWYLYIPLLYFVERETTKLPNTIIVHTNC